jgi:hypothetical protein
MNSLRIFPHHCHPERRKKFAKRTSFVVEGLSVHRHGTEKAFVTAAAREESPLRPKIILSCLGSFDYVDHSRANDPTALRMTDS